MSVEINKSQKNQLVMPLQKQSTSLLKKHRRNFLFLGGTALLGTGLALFPRLPQLKEAWKSNPFSFQPQFYSKTKKMMGTWVSISLFSAHAEKAHLAMDAAFGAIERVDQLMTIFSRKSDTSLLNQSAGQNVVSVHPWMIEILSTAQKISQTTQGAYSVGILPLMRLFGFYQSHKSHIPTDKSIAEVLDRVDYRLIQVDEQNQKVGLMKESMGVDLGSIGKGYALDKAVEVLRNFEIRSALLDAGGNLYAIGAPYEDSDPRMGWTIGIRDPQRPGMILKTIQIRDQAVATSGLDQNKVILDSQEIGHIFNAVSGKPVADYLSCSAVAKTGALSDALSTTGFILGKEKSEYLFPSSSFYFYS